MKDIKKFTDVIRYGKSTTNGVIQEGDYISITEKIDGANASFCRDEEDTKGVSSYSRNGILDETNRLRGYYDFILDCVVPIKNKLNYNYRYIGEWCCSHKIVYKPEAYKTFYLFSIWDDEKQMYLSDEIVKQEALKLGLVTPHYFYEGEFISFEHMMSFVGKSDITLEPNTGEGVVVKNVKYFDRFGKQCFVKLVSEKFAEVQKQRLPKNPNINSVIVETVKSCLTEARVSKLINKLVDENLLKEDYSIEDMGVILRCLGSSVYDDIIKEESDMFLEFKDKEIKKTIGKNLPNMIKTIIKSENRV